MRAYRVFQPWHCLVLTGVLLIWTPAHGDTLNYFQTGFRFAYHRALLQATLDVTDDVYPATELKAYPDQGEVPEARGLHFLEKGQIDVVFLSTSRERESRFLPVRMPLLRGLLGLRLLLINQQDQADFAATVDLERLKSRFKMGFQPQWVDYGIYQDNGFGVVTETGYEPLFAMLAEKRFDFFPRGVNEIYDELAYFRPVHPSLTIEETIALYYPYPVYFFVNRANTALAARLQLGLERLKANGDFQRLFDRHYGEAIAKAQLSRRRLFVLRNSTLPAHTPQVDSSWWLPTDID